MAEPTFVPKQGQVDYTNIRYAPVINVVVTHGDTFLLVQRSPNMRLYPNYWNWVGGFLDDDRSIEEKAREELLEELSIPESDIASLERGQVVLQEAPDYGKTWLVVPVRARVKTTEFTLDWEAQRAGWFHEQEIKNLDLLPGFDAVASQFMHW